MSIDPTWIVVALISAVFIIGFLVGYTLGRLEANKLFDLRDRVIQLKKNRDYWRDRFEDLDQINDGLHEQINRLKSKED